MGKSAHGIFRTAYALMAAAALMVSVHAGEPRLAASASRRPVTIPASFEGKRLAVYGGGALVVAEGDIAEPSLFSVYGTDGKLLAQIPWKIPGASRTVVYDYARGASGILAVCGFAESAGMHRAPYLAWISRDGTQQKVIRTEPYYPFLCTAAPDGSLWTAGLEMGPDMKEQPEYKDGPVVRRFDPDGRQIGAWLPRSSFPDNASLVRGFLAAGADRVGWLSWSVEDQGLLGTYREFTPEGEAGEFPLRGAPGLQSSIGSFDNMALTAAGDVLIAIEPSNRTGEPVVVTLDRISGNWRKVKLPVKPSPPWVHLYGADEEIAAVTGSDGKSGLRFLRFEK